MVSIAASLLLVGCVDYTIHDPDDVVPASSVVEERFVQEPLPKVDVLFVVDGTGSMEEEQASFADVADTFVDVLDELALSYQLGVTSTDPDQLGELLGRPWIITQAASDPSEALADALVVGTDSPPPAAGLYAASLALADTQGLNRGFRRPDASLHVVFISDGDDESDDYFDADPTAAFLAVLAEDADRTGLSARASALVGDVPDGCTGEAGTAQAGARYAAAATASGGEIASICAADYRPIAEGLGDATVDWPTVFPLQAVPAEGTVRVEVDGERRVDGWAIDATVPALVFAEPPAADAVISVVYTLPEAP